MLRDFENSGGGSTKYRTQHDLKKIVRPNLLLGKYGRNQGGKGAVATKVLISAL